MTIAARGRYQTPDEVFEALRDKGLLSAPSSATHEQSLVEAIARFLRLGAARCTIARVSASNAPAAPEGGPESPPLDCVLALLPGGVFIAAFGAEALPDPSDPPRPELVQLVEAVRELGGRVLIYVVGEVPYGRSTVPGAEILSIRASIEPFVREALRSHAESCVAAWTEDDERRVVAAGARLADGRELDAAEAIEQALTTSRRAVLLGDFGAGKSTEILRRAAVMAAAYLEDRDRNPCPLVLPLRGMPADLSEILHEHVPGLSLEAFLLAADLGVVVSMFDGFDELAVPPAGLRDAIASLTGFAADGPARILVASSTAGLRDQATLAELSRGAPPGAIVILSGLHRRGVLELIRKASASDAEAEARLAQIDAAHDLQALASRPALLDLIASRKRWLTAAGSPSPLTALYTAATRDWIRSSGPCEPTPQPQSSRPHLDPATASLAHAEPRILAARALARVLIETGAEGASPGEIAQTAAQAAVAGVDQDLLRRAAERLRQVAFIATVKGDGERLRFVHPSFLELFLAEDIAVRLDDARDDALDFGLLTPEIIGFLAGLDGWSKRKGRARAILQQPYRPRVSENALRAIYGAAALKVEGEALGKKLSEDLPCGAKLAGAKLAGAKLAWASLPEVDLTGADLSMADLKCADMRGSRFEKARLDHAIFDGADLEWASFSGADLFAASFVNANLAEVVWQGATTEGIVRIGARRAAGLVFSPGVEIGTESALRRVVESAPSMGQALAVSPDGKWLAVARGFTVAVIDAFTGSVRMVLSSGTSCALTAIFSPDGRLLVAASKDGMIRVWDVRRGALLRSLESDPSWVISLAFSPDCETLASASDIGPVRIWDTRRGHLLCSFEGRTAWFSAVAFSPSGDAIAAALADGSVRVWDARKGEVVRTLEGPAGPYMCVAFSPDGKLLASTSEDDSIRLWDARRGDLVRALRGSAGPFMSLAFTPGGDRLAAASASGGVSVWDVASGAIASVVAGSAGACAVSFAPSGEELFFTLDDGSIHLADARRGEVLRDIRGLAATVDVAAFSPAGDTLASASAGGCVRVWDARRGDLLHTLPGSAAMGSAMVFSLDGDVLAVASTDGSIHMWDARPGALRCALRAPEHTATALAFSLDGETLASGGADGSMALWDVHSGELRMRVGGGAARVGSVAFSPEGDMLAAAHADGPIRLWDMQGGAPLGTLSGHTSVVHSVLFLPDEGRLASASADGSIRFWDTRSCELLHTVEGRTGGPIHGLAFSPEGDTLASASADGLIRLWDAQGGDPIRELSGHTASVSSVAFSLDGDMLLSASADGSVRIWRVADGRCLCALLAIDTGWAALVEGSPYFVSGGDFSRLLRFAIGPSSMPASLWAPIFRRPDLVAKALWGDIPSPDAIGQGLYAACEEALIEARLSLGLARGRRDGPTAMVAVSKHAGPLPGLAFADDAARAERKLPVKRALTWIHLSDLHFGAPTNDGEHRFDQKAVMRAICRDIAEGALKSPDYLFVTGDVAWSGLQAEYDEARAWLEEVVQAARSSADRLRLVPGNHDVDRRRANTKPVARAHSEIRVAPEEIDNELSSEALRGALADKLLAYEAFVKAVAPAHPAPGPNGLDWSERVAAVPGLHGRVRLAGLSTVWISDGSDGRLHKGQAVPFIRNMILGERQIHQAFGDLEEDELLFVLTHHPPEWLHRDSAEELAKALGRKSHVHMCGHIHDAPQASVQKRFGAFGPAVRYVAGSSHGDPVESKKHGYAWGALRWNPDVSQWQAGWAPRVYDEERDMMRPDAARYTLDAEGFVWEPIRIHWHSPVKVEIQG